MRSSWVQRPAREALHLVILQRHYEEAGGEKTNLGCQMEEQRQGPPMISLLDIPNFVLVGAMAVRACGKMKDSSNVKTEVEAFAWDDISELDRYRNAQYKHDMEVQMKTKRTFQSYRQHPALRRAQQIPSGSLWFPGCSHWTPHYHSSGRRASSP